VSLLFPHFMHLTVNLTAMSWYCVAFPTPFVVRSKCNEKQATYISTKYDPCSQLSVESFAEKLVHSFLLLELEMISRLAGVTVHCLDDDYNKSSGHCRQRCRRHAARGVTNADCSAAYEQRSRGSRASPARACAANAVRSDRGKIDRRKV
jgi:hypothetical protein